MFVLSTWGNYSVSLGLSFLICEMTVIGVQVTWSHRSNICCVQMLSQYVFYVPYNNENHLPDNPQKQLPLTDMGTEAQDHTAGKCQGWDSKPETDLRAHSVKNKHPLIMVVNEA